MSQNLDDIIAKQTAELGVITDLKNDQDAFRAEFAKLPPLIQQLKDQIAQGQLDPVKVASIMQNFDAAIAAVQAIDTEEKDETYKAQAASA